MGDASFFLNVLIMLVGGIVCAFIAHHKGRNPLGHFLIGFLIPCVGIVLILCLSNLKEEKDRIQKQESQNRMLREQLRQEQIKLEALRHHTTARLDTHDQKLGIESRQAGLTPAIESGNAPDLLPEGGSEEPLDWFYLIGSNTQGPVSRSTLKNLHLAGRISDKTFVYRNEWADWKEYGKAEELS